MTNEGLTICTGLTPKVDLTSSLSRLSFLPAFCILFPGFTITIHKSATLIPFILQLVYRPFMISLVERFVRRLSVAEEKPNKVLSLEDDENDFAWASKAPHEAISYTWCVFS
jgi:hypothetical protein